VTLRGSDVTLTRAGLIVTATGIVSAASVSYALGGSDLAFAVGFLAYLGLIAFAAARRPHPRAYVVGFVAFALTYIGLDSISGGIVPATLLYVAAAVLAVIATPARFRALTVGAFALWTPAIRLFDPTHAFDGFFPLEVAIASVVALFSLVAVLVARQSVDDEERLRRIGLGLLGVACVATVAERHSVVASPNVLAPDDLAALAVVVLFPILAVARLRPMTRDAFATGLAVALYVLVGFALIAGKAYHVDTVVVEHRAAEVFLAGANPYTAVDLQDALREFGLNPQLATHLEDGSQVHTLNYPALSFLIIAPFVGLGLSDIRYVFLAEIVLLVLILLRPIRIPWRPLIVAVVVGNTIIERQNILAGVDPAWAVLTALAFMFIARRWLSPIFMGLAVACRQPAWFFLPFYVVADWRRDGPREAARRTLIAAAAAIVPNAPFILADPRAFWAGVTAPTLAPLEPYGVGLIRFALDGAIPLWPRGVYGALAVAALAGLLVVLWREWRSLPNAAVVFPSLVLWFGWRSLQNYFSFAGVFALIGDETMLADTAEPADAHLDFAEGREGGKRWSDGSSSPAGRAISARH
jgi:hypothetical protein